MSQTAPRIAPLEPPYAPEIQQQFDRIMRGAPPLVLFRVMAGNARAWEKFRAASLLDRGPLSLREREIVIDRTCARAGDAQRSRIRGAVGALRRCEDIRDHPAVRILPHRVISRERTGAAAGGEGGKISAIVVIARIRRVGKATCPP